MLIVAHGNSLRAMVKHLDHISDDDIVELNIPTGIPLRYDLDEHYRPVTPGGSYLDPEGGGRGGRGGQCAIRARNRSVDHCRSNLVGRSAGRCRRRELAW